jgi:hypothetical protein
MNGRQYIPSTTPKKGIAQTVTIRKERMNSVDFCYSVEEPK